MGLPSELWQLPVHVGDSPAVDSLPIDFSLYSRVYKVSEKTFKQRFNLYLGFPSILRSNMILIPLRPAGKKSDWLKDDQLQALWDTGASHSFVNRQLAKILKGQGWQMRAVAPMNGRGIKSSWRVDQAIGLRFRVGLTQQEFFWEFLVNDLPNKFSFMIGMDFMAQHNFVVEPARHCVHWRAKTGLHQVVLASVKIALAIGKAEEDRLAEARKEKREKEKAPTVNFFSQDDTDWHFWRESLSCWDSRRRFFSSRGGWR